MIRTCPVVGEVRARQEVMGMVIDHDMIGRAVLVWKVWGAVKNGENVYSPCH